jgi:ABC-type Fe3+-siderophore transport system permease subunit
MKAALLCALVTGFTAPFIASPTGDPFTMVYFAFVGAILAFGATLGLARIQRFQELLLTKRWLAIGAVCLALNVFHGLFYLVLIHFDNRDAAFPPKHLR